MTCGIYLLEFKNTEKVYIGQSINIEDRFTKHLTKLNSKSASNKLQSAFIEYGYPTLSIILECLPEELNDKENLFIDLFNSVNEGFNTYQYSSGVHIGLHGEDSKKSKYTNKQYIEVFNLLCEGISHKEIQNLTNVSIYTIQSISKGSTCKWLEKYFPEKYNILMSLKNKRLKGVTKLSAKILGIEYPKIKDPLGNEYIVENITQFAKQYNLIASCLGRVLRKERKTHKGWTLA